MYTTFADQDGRLVKLARVTDQGLTPIKLDENDTDYAAFVSWARANRSLIDRHALPPGDTFFGIEPLVAHCRQFGIMLHFRPPIGFSEYLPMTHGGVNYVGLQQAWLRPREDRAAMDRFALVDQWDLVPHGIVGYVPASVLRQLSHEAKDDDSEARKVSSWTTNRAFAYLDVSDFSMYTAGEQALVIASLVNTVENRTRWTGVGEQAVSQLVTTLCIGDGYIYVFKEPVEATIFAAYLGALIEALGAKGVLPVPFHFRMGIHAGPVYSFWDPGRKGWNFIGEGINGGNRVLTAMGKEHDDAIYVSAEVREAIRRNERKHGNAQRVLSHFRNEGRHADKHKRPWRVYELDHTALCGQELPEELRP